MPRVDAIAPQSLSTKALQPQRTEMGRDAFLKLLTMQLRLQNPVRPYDGQELAAQLAVFSQLEQLLSMRQLMELEVGQLSALMEGIGSASAPALLGSTVRAETGKLLLGVQGSVRVGCEVPQGTAAVRMEVLASDGRVLRSVERRGVSAGEQWFEWDGTDAAANRLPAGEYRIRIVATMETGGEQELGAFVEGVVEAVRFAADGAYLRLGGIEVPLSAVLEVRRR
jgi:flagellar basal-body rod modification protein FlgD